MNTDLSQLERSSRCLFEIPLDPIQGSRFQPTGFPGLGAATFQTATGQHLLVESAQSMANRLELTCWDDANQDLRTELKGLSHVRVLRNGKFLTDTILEAHRLNSPYLLKSKTDKTVMNLFSQEFGREETGVVDRRRFAELLLRYDIGSLLHGIFISQSELAGGRLRLARALSSFIEAKGVRIAPSGGVKNDHVHPSKVAGDRENRFGNIPFARDEFTGEITLYANLDLAQIRGYGLGHEVELLLVLLALYKLRSLIDGNLRLRTACDLRVIDDHVKATNPADFELPATGALLEDLRLAIDRCGDRMEVKEVSFNDKLKKAKDEPETNGQSSTEDNNPEIE